MKTVSFIFILMISSYAHSSCEKSEKSLQSFLATIPTTCSRDEDCKTYLAFPGGCKDPYVGNLGAQKILDGKDFQQLRTDVIKNCQAKWNLMGACAPGWNKKKVRCVDKRCMSEGSL